MLELIIVVAIVGAIIFVALPTLQPTAKEASIDQAKAHLKYLAAKEQEYFTRHGNYAPFTKLAEDETIGKEFDGRFAKEEPIVDGVKFKGPVTEAKIFDIVAEFPDGARYKIDRTGKVLALQ